MINDKALRIYQVADILSVHRQTVWNLIKSGKLKAVNVSTRRRIVWESDLKKYIDKINCEAQENIFVDNFKDVA